MRSALITQAPTQTKKLGEFLAKEILKTHFQKRAFILCLEGDLGGGKTTFLQGFARGLGIKQKILSPTFIIMKKFLISNGAQAKFGRVVGGLKPQFLNFYHVDCYRIEKPKEILNLGFKKIISNPENIVTIEWADRVKKILPKKSLIIKFELINQKKRKIIFQYGR